MYYIVKTEDKEVLKDKRVVQSLDSAEFNLAKTEFFVNLIEGSSIPKILKKYTPISKKEAQKIKSSDLWQDNNFFKS